MHELAITAIGVDRPGIVAAVTRVLHERGANLEDSAMQILGGHFAIVLLVRSEDDPDVLHDALQEATGELGLTIGVTRAVESEAGDGPTHLLSVYGADKPGIVASVTAAIAEVGANVVDLGTRVLGEGERAVYAMVVELATDDPERLAAAVEAACRELDVDHTLRALDAETY